MKYTNASSRKRIQESISKIIVVSAHMRQKGLMTPACEKKFARIFDDLHSLKNKLK
jgi:hypothetical protein